MRVKFEDENAKNVAEEHQVYLQRNEDVEHANTLLQTKPWKYFICKP